jgi:hypothetical protein
LKNRMPATPVSASFFKIPCVIFSMIPCLPDTRQVSWENFLIKKIVDGHYWNKGSCKEKWIHIILWVYPPIPTWQYDKSADELHLGRGIKSFRLCAWCMKSMQHPSTSKHNHCLNFELMIIVGKGLANTLNKLGRMIVLEHTLLNRGPPRDGMPWCRTYSASIIPTFWLRIP